MPPPAETVITAHGIKAALPAGWSGRIFRHHPEPPEVSGPTLHAGNFAIPLDDADFGSALTGHLRPGRVAFIYNENIPDQALVPGVGLYEPYGFPESVTFADFDPNVLQARRQGQLGLQRFFTIGPRRLGMLYVVLGGRDSSERPIAEVNWIISQLEFASSPEESDYRPVPKRRRDQ
jgi:hypothetical protein